MRAARWAGLVLAGITVTAAAASPAHARPDDRPAPAAPDAVSSQAATGPRPRAVTLITGDRLLVSPDGTAATRLPTPGRDGVELVSQYVRGHLEVVPADALGLLATDRLDPHLFDVTELLADGDDDNVPVIVTYDGDDPASAVGAVAGGGPVRELDAIKALSVRVTAGSTGGLWRSMTGGALRTAYRKVWLDGLARPAGDTSVPLVGAPAAWAAGYTGSGVPVGVLDTGVDAGHPDLAQAVAATADFTGDGDTGDPDGHGTHVASVIAGSGAASGGRYRGMAPDARLYSARVCRAGRCPESAILAGMQWAARDQRLRVVNLSLERADERGTDLLERAVDTLTARYGTLFVVAAGDEDGRVASPASANSALAVGATTMDDTFAGLSGSGPRAGDSGLKPDIAAPGVDVGGARSRASSRPGLAPAGLYTAMSGSSAAAPHVAGAAALLAQEHPDWTAADLKSALMNAATPVDRTGVDQVGAGRLDVARAVSATVLGTPAGLSYGRLTGPETRTVTFRNDGAGPVDLDLAVDTDPPGTFALDTDRLTVPPHGTAAVLVTATPGGRRATGALTATGGDTAIRIPLTVEKLRRSYGLTLRWTDRYGSPADRTYGLVSSVDGRVVARLPNAGGTGTLRLPAGRYTLHAAIAGPGMTMLDQPRLVLDRDTTVDLDARLGRPVAVSVPEPGATQVYARVGVTTARYAADVQTSGGDLYTAQLGTAQLGTAGSPAGFRTVVASTWARPGAGSPYLYSLAWSVPGRFVTGFARSVAPGDLTAVDATYAGTGTTTVPFGAGGWGYASTFTAPLHRTEFRTTGAGVSWGGWVGAAGTPYLKYTPGPDTETWNAPVFSPAWTAGSAATRTGDTLSIAPAWFSDSGGHGDTTPGATHRLTVLRDGIRVVDTSATATRVALPSRNAALTVTAEAARDAAYSSSIRTIWTFRSGRTTRATALPMPVIRFAPAGGGVLSFTVSAGPINGFGLRVSYDGGATWRDALVVRVGDHGIAMPRPPAGARVSLRAWASDAAGNRVEQTIINAY